MITGTGTSEDLWRPWLRALAPPPLPLDPLPTRVVVVAPHPDDEVLAVGGLLALLTAAGVPVEVLAVTDGEASNPGGSVRPAALATLRRAETRAALQALGIDATVTRLGLPDGGAAGLEQPTADALALDASTWLLAPWAGDGHPDHEAVGRAATTAAERDGARLLAYPVWAWHWAGPDDPRVPWDRLRTVALTGDLQVVKAAALQQFASQVRPLGPLPEDAPVLPPHVLARFARDDEVVLA